MIKRQRFLSKAHYYMIVARSDYGIHFKDGLYFKRIENGDVLVTKIQSRFDTLTRASESRFHNSAGDILFQTVIDRNTWLAIMSAVSKRGDCLEQFIAADGFHNG